MKDLKRINEDYLNQNNRVVFTSIEGRVKSEISFFKKLYKICIENGKTQGVTPSLLNDYYNEIKDLAGVRFSCPYYDEVKSSINTQVRSKLNILGYATDLNSRNACQDKDYLDTGDEHGYRSYHFYVDTPTIVDIFNRVKLCMCEVQARTELQHIWAVKSHDLLYKNEDGWKIDDKNVVEDMRQISNSLRAADQFLMSVRDRVNGE